MYVTYACTYSVSRIVAKGCDIGYSKYGPKVKKHYRLHSEHTNLLIPRLEDAGSRMLPNNPKVCIFTPQSVRRSKRNWVASNLFCNHPSLSQSLLKLHKTCWGRAFPPFWSAALLEEIGTATTTSLDHPSRGLSRHELLGRWMYHDMSQVALAGGSQIWNM